MPLQKSAESPTAAGALGQEPAYVHLDPFLVERAMLEVGLSRKGLVEDTGQSLNTMNRIHQRQGLRANSALLIAKRLGCKVVDLLAPYDPRYQLPQHGTGPGLGNSEWEVAAYLDQGRLTPNGLYYITCRLEHRFVQQRQGRGKYFHLSWLRPQVRSEIQHQLVRHAEVSARLGSHSNLTFTVSSQPAGGNDGWWIVDAWVGGQTLENQLQNGPLPAAIALAHLRAMAEGLKELHTAQVILRELSPQRILISDSDGRAVLTDFELAKVLDAPVSVSKDWPADPYRAPEIQGSAATVQADLYSFGRVAAAMFGGTSAMLTDDEACLDQVKLPSRLKSLLVKCLAPDPTMRPPSVEPLLKELTRVAK